MMFENLQIEKILSYLMMHIDADKRYSEATLCSTPATTPTTKKITNAYR